MVAATDLFIGSMIESMIEKKRIFLKYVYFVNGTTTRSVPEANPI